MFDNFISTRLLATDSQCYERTLRELDEAFDYHASLAKRDITYPSDFITLHRITKDFYAQYFPEIFENYVPLYHSLWKLRLRDLSMLENIHQDGGVHYFSANGYRSRMITLWTNIHKDHIPGLADSDMGLFVVDNTNPANSPLYEQFEAANTHFHMKRKNQFMDNMYVGGKFIGWDVSKLVRTYFDYRPGMVISFNSHLLHGSKAFLGDLSRYSEEDLEKFRVSLVAVWLHKEDVAWSVVGCPETDYENLYLSRVDEHMRADVKRIFSQACGHEAMRLATISALIKEHIGAEATTPL